MTRKLYGAFTWDTAEDPPVGGTFMVVADSPEEAHEKAVEHIAKINNTGNKNLLLSHVLRVAVTIETIDGVELDFELIPEEPE